MDSHLMAGFTDELVKTAGKTAILKKVMEKLKNPELRRRLKKIQRGATLGGITGGAGALASGGDDPALERVLRGAAGAATGGAIAGALFPAWFASSQRKL
jgi:hypothetical protein